MGREHRFVKTCVGAALACGMVLGSACSDSPTATATPQSEQQSAGLADAPDRKPQWGSRNRALGEPFSTPVRPDTLALAHEHRSSGETDSHLASHAEDSPSSAARNREAALKSDDGGRQAPLFLVGGDASSVYWEPNPQSAAYRTGSVPDLRSVELTVSGPAGQISSRRFAPGETVGIAAAAGGFADGTYKWETVTIPWIDPYVREQMSAVRQSGDLAAETALIARLRAEGVLPTEKQAQANVQSGSFRIQDGAVVRTYAQPEEAHGQHDHPHPH